MPGIDGIGGAPAVPASAAGALGGLDSDAFLKLLVAQLRYQNPMAPADHGAMLQQTAQFTQVETLQQVAKAQQQLLISYQAGMASALVGQHVTAVADDGSPLAGVVTATRFTADGPLLLLDGREVHLARVVEVRTTPDTTA